MVGVAVIHYDPAVFPAILSEIDYELMGENRCLGRRTSNVHVIRQ